MGIQVLNNEQNQIGGSGSLTAAAIEAALADSGLTVGGQIVAKAMSASPASGQEQIAATADRDFSADTGKWSGTGWSVAGGAAVHTAGENNFDLDISALVVPPIPGNTYIVTFTVTTTTPSDSGIFPILGGGSTVDYYGLTIGSQTVTAGILASDDTGLIFRPDTVWEGSIDNVSVSSPPTSSFALVVLAPNGSVAAGIFADATNLGIGANVLASILLADPVGSQNVGVGHDALSKTVNGVGNVAVGVRALGLGTSLANNVAIGGDAMPIIGTVAEAQSNVSIGDSSMNNATSGDNNTVVGMFGMYYNIQGHDNTALGYGAGYEEAETNPNNYSLADTNMVFVGKHATRSGDDSTNHIFDNGIAIGHGATVLASNHAVIGNSAITDAYFGSETGAAKLHGKGDAIVFPDADPHVVGAAYWAAGVLTRSAG